LGLKSANLWTKISRIALKSANLWTQISQIWASNPQIRGHHPSRASRGLSRADNSSKFQQEILSCFIEAAISSALTELDREIGRELRESLEIFGHRSTGPARYICSGSCALIQTKIPIRHCSWELNVEHSQFSTLHHRLVFSRFKLTVKLQASILESWSFHRQTPLPFSISTFRCFFHLSSTLES